MRADMQVITVKVINKKRVKPLFILDSIKKNIIIFLYAVQKIL